MALLLLWSLSAVAVYMVQHKGWWSMTVLTVDSSVSCWLHGKSISLLEMVTDVLKASWLTVIWHSVLLSFRDIRIKSLNLFFHI